MMMVMIALVLNLGLMGWIVYQQGQDTNERRQERIEARERQSKFIADTQSILLDKIVDGIASVKEQSLRNSAVLQRLEATQTERGRIIDEALKQLTRATEPKPEKKAKRR
jgi:hypothetical protein